MNHSKQSIAFFGSSLVSAYWNGAATYYRGIIKYLHKLGYSITFYEPDAYGRQENRDIADPPYARSVVYKADQQSLDRAIEEAQKADIIVKASGVGVFDALIEEILPEIKKSWQKIIFWDVDAPATLDSVFRDAAAPFRKSIPLYDYIFTYGGGDPVINAYKSLGARECIPVYNALDPETHFRVKSEPRFECDLSFLGNRLPDREARVRSFFLEVAEKMPGSQFMLGGNGWDNLTLPGNVRYVNHVFSKDHNAFNSSSKIVLNISRQSMADYGFSPATRIFEAAGAGACIITDYWNGIEKFLIPGKEILVAGSGEEVAELMQETDGIAAAAIGKAAERKVLSEHTYEQRAMLINKIFSELEVPI